MVEVTVDHLGAVQFEARARGHRVFSDQPLENGGFDEGMTPPEYFLVALGTCAGHYAVEYLKARHLSTTGLRVHTTAEKVKNPGRLDDIRIAVDCPEGLAEKDREGVLRACEKCLIHNTLTHPPKLRVELTQANSALDPSVAAEPAAERPAAARAANVLPFPDAA
jgi:uncharacterized OsmC-like protein